MCFQIFFSIKVMLKPSENVMNSHFHGGTTEQFWVKDVSFYLIFLCIFWQFFEFCFAQNFKLSINYLKNSFPCSKNYLICLNLSLNTPYFTSVFPSQWSLNLMAAILLVIVLLCPPNLIGLIRLFYRHIDGSGYKKSGREGLKLEFLDKIH